MDLVIVEGGTSHPLDVTVITEKNPTCAGSLSAQKSRLLDLILFHLLIACRPPSILKHGQTGGPEVGGGGGGGGGDFHAMES